MMTDPIADMLTRLRNANRIERPAVDMPYTVLKKQVAQVLKDEGYVVGFEVGALVADESGAKTFQPATDLHAPKLILRVFMKYGPEGERVFRRIDRASRPGRRLYRSYKQLRPVLDGLGIAILSTNKGVLSDRQARTQQVGGELLCTVW